MFERLSGEPIYNTRAVAQRTGVPADTFRAWERRYALPVPGRTSGNQRLYSERDIATIQWLREQTSAGLTISQAVALFRTQPDRVARDGRDALLGSPSGPTVESTNGVVAPATALGAAARRLVDALLRLDGSAADRIVDEALALGDVDGICVDLLEASLNEIGHQWERGEAGVVIEHFASAFVERKLGALLNQSNPSRGRGPIVAACVAGERHHLGLLTTTVLLSRAGYHIVYLGADLPYADLTTSIEQVAPALVLLSASQPDTAETLRSWVEELPRIPGDQSAPHLAYGGRVFADAPALRSAIPATYLGHDARVAVRNVERVLSGLPVAVS